MPISLVLKFHTKDIIKNNISKQFHGFLFNHLRDINSSLSCEIHNSDIKPFSISPVMEDENNGLWIKISLLTDELILNMLPFFENCIGNQYHIGKYNIIIDKILYFSNDNDWISANEYSDIIDMPISNRLKFEFLTPTTFKQGNHLVPMPIPKLIFQNILKKWNTFSPYKITDFDLETLEESILILGYNIKTQKLEFNNFSSIGFVGNITFSISDYTDKNLIKAINILSNYAIYSGVGYKSTMGMGVCRKLNL